VAATRTPLGLILSLALLLGACGTDASPSVPVASGPPASVAATPSPQASIGTGEVVPAPGSDSEVYAPNPEAIVVAIDPGHGGCLDWGVPNPWDNVVEKSEKTDTLAIGLALRELLESQGITVVMTRTDDVALAGDFHPDLGCDGPPWRDVDGNGEAGFEETGRTRTRDELQARIDLANLARADLLVSIHINSMTQDGVAFEIAATQTFYDDETPWGEDGSGELGRLVQSAVVDSLGQAATYERQDRGTEAVAYYMISRQWRDGDTCETPGDTWCKPHRGAQLPAVLAEVGSITLEAESELLAQDAGRRAAAEGLYDGIREWLGQRPLGVRYDALLPGGEAGALPEARPGDGPPYAAANVGTGDLVDGALPVRLTNTGQRAWGAIELLAGWQASDAPYLATPPELRSTGAAVPPLAPGESVTVHVPLEPPGGGRSVLWLTLADGSGPFTDHGSPALQLAWGGN
jgi:N-acetylmuramoyl-L-alanine amidase